MLLLEPLQSIGPCLVPVLSVAGILALRGRNDAADQGWRERLFYAILLLVGCTVVRTVAVNDACWLLHCGSLAILVLGALFPLRDPQAHTTCESYGPTY